MCWMCCHPSSGDSCECSVHPPSTSPALPEVPGCSGSCLCCSWCCPMAWSAGSTWSRQGGCPAAPGAVLLLGALQAVSGTLGLQLFPAVINASVSFFQKFLHSSPHFILFSTASFGHTFCFCLLTIPVGIT